MEHGSAIFSIFVIFVGAAVLATIALWARQAIIVAYIAVGVLLGPSGLGLVGDAEWLQEVSEIGIVFLLYLLGLNMVPRQLWQMFRAATRVTLLSSLIFMALGAGAALAFDFPMRDAVVIGAAMMFSSTIIGLKLLPTTALHHQHTGQIMISVLLLQDLVAIVVLLLLQGTEGDRGAGGFVRELIALPLLGLVAYACERWLLEPLMLRFDRIQEYLFLLVIAWCLAMAELARAAGLSLEIGAFVAGVALANCPAGQFIADSLRALRDFFLILFFFSVGAALDPTQLGGILLPAAVLAALMLVVKPWIFRLLLRWQGEPEKIAREAGARLGQISEFSLLVAVLAAQVGALSVRGSNLVQLATVITFVISSYYIVMYLPSPMAISDKLRQD
ncbi:MAG: cation:proton antiporter [Gammaproteobacteria bacterium]|nr:cation:proton antiporter [Gammaproteobacteria bacterium]